MLLLRHAATYGALTFELDLPVDMVKVNQQSK